MSNRSIVLAVFLGVILFTIFCFLTKNADAQETWPDIALTRQGSTYNINCQPVEPIDLLAQICVVRTDLEGIIELGCIDHIDLTVATLTVSVDRTPHLDGQLRCYAVDTELNSTNYSENAGIVDFTPPGRPHVK